MPKFNINNTAKSRTEMLRFVTCKSIKSKNTDFGIEKTVVFTVKPTKLIQSGYQYLLVEVEDEIAEALTPSPTLFNEGIKKGDMSGTTGQGTVDKIDFQTLMPENNSLLRRGKSSVPKSKRTEVVTRRRRNLDNPRFTHSESFTDLLSKGDFNNIPNDVFPGVTTEEVLDGKIFSLDGVNRRGSYEEQPTVKKVQSQVSDYTAETSITTRIKKSNHILKYYLYNPSTSDKIAIPLNPTELNSRIAVDVVTWKLLTEGPFSQKLDYTKLEDYLQFDVVFYNIPLLKKVCLYVRELTDNPGKDIWEEVGKFNLENGTDPTTKYWRYPYVYHKEKNYMFRLMPIVNDMTYEIYSEAICINNPFLLPKPRVLTLQNAISKKSVSAPGAGYDQTKIEVRNIHPAIEHVKVYKNCPAILTRRIQSVDQNISNTTKGSFVYYESNPSVTGDSIDYEPEFTYNDINFRGYKTSHIPKVADPRIELIFKHNQKNIALNVDSSTGDATISGNLHLSHNYIWQSSDNLSQPNADLILKIQKGLLVPYLKLTRIDQSLVEKTVVGEFPLWKNTETDGVKIITSYDESGISFEIKDSNDLSEMRGLPRLPTRILYQLEYAAYPLSYLVYQYNDSFKMAIETTSTSLNYSRNMAYYDSPQYTKFGKYPTESDMKDVSKQHEFAYTPECFIISYNGNYSEKSETTLSCSVVKGGVELKIKIPTWMKEDLAVDFIQITARPTNLAFSQVINTVHPLSNNVVYYDFDTPNILCDEIEYTAKLYSKEYNLLAFAGKVVSIKELTQQTINNSQISKSLSTTLTY